MTEKPRPNEGNSRLSDVLETLQEGTERVLTSEGFQSYLKLLSKLHNYSYSNVLLIYAQKPDATLVNSYDRWKQLGRQVNKGERGIKILFPIFPKKEDLEEGKETPPVRYGVGNVFDVSQTSGDPLPEPPSAVGHDTSESELSATIYRRTHSYLTSRGIKVTVENLRNEKGGFYRPKANQITINQEVTLGEFSNAKTRILVHEAAHFMADHKAGVDRDEAESVAEGSAYATLYHFGIDTGDRSFSYIASWAEDMAVLKRNLASIQQTAHGLITAIESTPDPHSSVDIFTGAPQVTYDQKPLI